MSEDKYPIPDFGLPIAETHFHLDYLKQAKADEILSAARVSNIQAFLTISVSAGNLDEVYALAGRHEGLYVTQGIHPHEAETYSTEVEEKIRNRIESRDVLAVGEIGLDYYYDHADRKVQRDVFARQLQIAIDSGKPVVIHSREADEDTRAILSEYAGQMKNKGVIHSFTSGQSLADFCLDAGFMLGFNGIITFPKAENVRDVLRNTPLNRILTETDSPYLTPVPYRGRENAPRYLPFIIKKIAELKERPVEEVLEACWENAMQTFAFQQG